MKKAIGFSKTYAASLDWKSLQACTVWVKRKSQSSIQTIFKHFKRTGWSQSVRVPDAANFFYPIGPVDCCTPSLLLSNGDVRELERCDCVQENGINCGSQSTGRMLSGFLRWGWLPRLDLKFPPLFENLDIPPVIVTRIQLYLRSSSHALKCSDSISYSCRK